MQWSISKKLILITLLAILLPAFIGGMALYREVATNVGFTKLNDLMNIIDARYIHILDFLKEEKLNVQKIGENHFIHENLARYYDNQGAFSEQEKNAALQQISSYINHIKEYSQLDWHAMKKEKDEGMSLEKVFGREVKWDMFRLEERLYRQHEILIIGLDGKIITSTNKDNIGIDMTGTDIFEKGSKGIFIKDVHEDRDGSTVMAFAAPLIHKPVNGHLEHIDKKNLGVAVLKINTNFLTDLITGDLGNQIGGKLFFAGYTPSTDFYLINKEGYMITQSKVLKGKKDTILKQQSKTLPWQRCVNDDLPVREAQDFYLNYNNMEVGGASMCVFDMKWTVVIEQDKDEILALFAHIGKIMAIIGLAMAIATSLLLFFLIRKTVITPLDRLAIATEQLERGHHSIRVQIDGNDEMSLLGNAFNKMAEVIQSTTQELQANNQQLEERVEWRTRELNKTNSFMTSLIENLGIGILLENEARSIINVNQAYCDILKKKALPLMLEGEDGTQEVNQNKALFTDPEAYGRLIKYCLQCRAAITLQELPLADGRILEMEYYPIFMEGEQGQTQHGHLWSYRDITAQKQIEQQIQQQSRKLERAAAEERILSDLLRQALMPSIMENYLREVMETVFEVVPFLQAQPKGGIFLTEDEGRGETLELIVGHDLALPLYDLCASVPFGKCLCGRAAAERTIQFAHCADERHETEFEGMAPHGHYCLPLLQHDIVLGVMVLYLEHGHQKSDREVGFLQQMADVIGMGIGLRYTHNNLIQAKEQAEVATKIKSQFLATMSHEIRTPMNGVVGMVDLLGETELDVDQQHMLGTIRDSAFGLLNIINDILDFSKIEAGKLEIDHIPTSIAEVMESVAKTLAPSAERKGIEFNLYIDPTLPAEVICDPIRLRQILFNLGGNAIKFTGTQEGKCNWVWMRAELAQLKDEGQTSLLFRISDNGIGMSEEVQTKLFQPFTQADSATTRRFGGTGLGLSITQNLVGLLGGKIEVKSTENVGSEFTVILPSTTASRAANAQPEQPLQGLRVLLLSDNASVQSMLSEYLQYWGASLQLTRGLNELMHHVGIHPQVVLMDSNWSLLQQKMMIHWFRHQAFYSEANFVLLHNEADNNLADICSDTVTIQATPLLPSALLHGLLVASGQASPSVNHEPTLLKSIYTEAPSIEAAESNGTLILVAEDNITNQDVLIRQLNLLGYAAEVADDGQQALAQWQKKPYSLLLTDCHMPEMDGFELTAQIRQLEQKSSIRRPIVAITANAMQGEAERCLEAGMDDYLAKPVELDKLKRMVRKWLPLGPDETSNMDEAAAPDQSKLASKADEQPPLRPGALTKLVGDNPEIHAVLLAKFETEAQQILEDLHKAFENCEVKAVKATAHKLKSSSRAVGAEILADYSEALEIAAKDEEWLEIERLEPKVQDAYLSVAAYLKEQRGTKDQ